MEKGEIRDKICIPLDVDTMEEAEKIIKETKEYVGIFKLNSLFTKYGRESVDLIKKHGCRVFLDLKFHDIPNTVVNYAKIAADMEVDIFNVHCLGGEEMMKAAKKAVNSSAIVLGVTILTSMDDKGLKQVGINKKADEEVKQLAMLAKNCGLNGVVASPNEISIIKKSCGNDFLVITPGIRPEWSSKDEQKRIATPKYAIEGGADIIVVGRAITAAKDVKEAARKIYEEVAEAEQNAD